MTIQGKWKYIRSPYVIMCQCVSVCVGVSLSVYVCVSVCAKAGIQKLKNFPFQTFWNESTICYWTLLFTLDLCVFACVCVCDIFVQVFGPVVRVFYSMLFINGSQKMMTHALRL